MLNQNHPDDERLSALASREADATADATLTLHVSGCDRCTELIDELGALRMALADLPDLRPSRPLQLLPPAEVAEPVADRLGGWARRFFAPVLASGAALALVGVIGTAAPSLSGMASGGGPSAPPGAAQQEAAEGADSAAGAGEAPLEFSASVDSLHDGAVTGDGDQAAAASAAALDRATSSGRATTALPDEADDASAPISSLPPERSPWPMVLFAGVALIVAAVLMRWVLAPKSS